ncbi:MAG: Biopolymer transport protein ExbD/TolR [Planctomycetaceae bacterium]|nr:Biopolymer transport protein ExbD/TolR [Planctomycetaceae bacterium]
MKIPRKKFRAEVPSVAMGDIAFNLLIFFVILARAQDDSHLKWQPASTPTVEAVKNVGVSVVIDIDSKLYLNGREIGESELASAIEKLLENVPAGRRTVLLKVDRNVTALRFEPVIEAVSKAGGDLVHILEEKSTPNAQK